MGNYPNVLALIDDNEVNSLNEEECQILQKLIRLNMKMTTYEDREIFLHGGNEVIIYNRSCIHNY